MADKPLARQVNAFRVVGDDMPDDFGRPGRGAR